MKAAYIFFGQVKNFDNRQYNAFEKNVKSKLVDYDIDYFLVTSRAGNYDNPRQKKSEGGNCKINHNSIKRHFDFKCIYYDELDCKKDTEIDDLAESIVETFGGKWEEDSLLSTINSLKQLYSLEYFYEQFSKCGLDYDVYILSRSDLFHTQDLKINFLDQDFDVLVPYFEDYPEIDYGWFGGINDRFAVIKNTKALKTYCCRYSKIKSSPEPYHAEKYLLKRLKDDYLTCGRIPSFNFRLIRANGKITDLIGITVDEYMSVNLNKISEAYFINLERRKDRLEHINKHLRFHAERFEAVDAQEAQLNDEIKKLFPSDFLTRPKAEICCALSHYKLWKKLIADECAENYLIMEDDVVFKPGFKEFWNDVFSRDFPENSLITYLGGCQPWNKPHYHKVLKQYNSYFNTIHKNDYFSKGDHYWQMNAHSYIMSKQAAILLCDWIEEYGMGCAVDHFILNFFTKNKKYFAPHRIYHLNPLMTYQLHEENDNTELDKKSDLRFAKETFNNLDCENILYWKHSVGSGNFGDELNVPIGKFLFGENAVFNQKSAQKSIRLIGSNLGDVEDGDIVCGVGLHHHNQKINSKNIQVNCVRGPLSLKALNQQLDSPVDSFLGDPALLLKLFYRPDLSEGLADKIGVVPHISNIDYFKKQVDQLDDFYLINPTNCWEQVVSEIYSCKLVISSSLHGLICADAYDKPNVWIKVPGMSIPPCDENTNYGDFKYWDYLMSQGRDVNFIKNLTDDFGNKIYTQGNRIDLQKMYHALCGKSLISNDSFPHLKEISSKQIPKKIHLSWKDKNVLNSDCALIQKGAKNLERLNPDWDVQVYDDEDINRLLRDSIGRDNWDLIKDKKITEKTDLWRLIKTYKDGGMYVDIDRYVDTSLGEIIDSETSCVLPTFQDVDFSQDFILTCAQNPIIGRAIGANLNYRKQGRELFFLAVHSYMHAVSSVLSGKIIERKNNPNYFNDIRDKIDACSYMKTYRELGAENHILFRNKSGDFSMNTFDIDKANFYNSYKVVHWNNQTQQKHNSLQSNKIKLIFLQEGLFEEDFVCELFSGVEFDKIVDCSMSIVDQNSIIVYSDIYSKNANIYSSQAQELLNQRKTKHRNYFEKLKDKNCILVHLSDEHCHAEIDHYKNFKHVFRQYYRSDAVADNVTFIPLGYKKGFNL